MAHLTKTEQSVADGRKRAIERTGGMFAYLAPGVSLADELIADRRAEGEGEQPPFSCIGAFSSGQGDLSKLASEDVFEPEPFR